MKLKDVSSLILFSPYLTIKHSHLSEEDVKNIKYSLLHKICITCLVSAVLLLLINLVSFFIMGFETNWKQIDVYGVTSLIGQVVSIIGTIVVIVLSLISITNKADLIKNRLAHTANVAMFLIMMAYMFLSLHADVEQGFLSVTPTLSPSIALISFFLLIQPVFWIEAIVLDGVLSLGLIGVSIFYANQYDMRGLMYYILVAVFLPIASYMIISILFYAETQRYCEELRNEALHNTAYYDELTLCKNRYALKENIEKWKSDEESNLLVMMFDIDDFKLYNDQYSHIGGDYCLKAIADSVRKTFPSPTLNFYRYGGEEFLLCLEVDRKEEAIVMIEKVRLAVAKLNIPAPKGAPCEYVTISVGGVLANVNDINDFNEIIKDADQYLYEAKRKGKNISVLNGLVVNK
ncbi:MAG: GGDEF domain-containing protein [Bacilli bacterium]|nr:GGDEF domain-containing protein [Bacilli bacterium]